MKRRFAALFLCAALMLLCGCVEELSPYVPTGSGLAGEDVPTEPEQTLPQEQTFSLAYYRERSLNPLEATDSTNRTLFSLIYQGLFAVDREYNPMPILCRSYKVSEDMRTYTFYIQDAKFSDGTALTPEDVYETLDAAIDSAVYGGRFTHVYRLELEDDGGITFRMDTPCENLPILLDVPILKASELSDPTPLGTGPYRMETTTAGVRLRKVSDWWCSAALPVSAAAISLREAKSPTQIRDDFAFSSLGLVCADPNSDQYGDFRCDYELWDCESGTFLFLACNMQSPVFSNPELRGALTYAIDRNQIAEQFYHGFARTATLPASPQSPYYTQSLAQQYAYDPDRFAYVVKDAALSEDTTVRLLVNGSDSLRLRVAKSIQRMLEAGGLTVEVEAEDYSDYRKALQKGAYDLYLGETRLSANMDLTAFFSPKGSMNFGDLSDAVIYSLCLESLANRGNYYNLHSAVVQDGRLCPILFQSYAVYANRGLVSGLSPSRDAVFYYDLGVTLSDILAENE